MRGGTLHGLLGQGGERHRLNPGGNRAANRALHMVALNHLRRNLRTREYVARRTAEGKSKKEAMRCLKRYIARETYAAACSWMPGHVSRRIDEHRTSRSDSCCDEDGLLDIGRASCRERV